MWVSKYRSQAQRSRRLAKPCVQRWRPSPADPVDVVTPGRSPVTRSHRVTGDLDFSIRSSVAWADDERTRVTPTRSTCPTPHYATGASSSASRSDEKVRGSQPGSATNTCSMAPHVRHRRRHRDRSHLSPRERPCPTSLRSRRWKPPRYKRCCVVTTPSMPPSLRPAGGR